MHVATHKFASIVVVSITIAYYNYTIHKNLNQMANYMLYVH